MMNSRIKPVFLVIAHDQPQLLNLLVQRLSPYLVFVHLNLNCDREEFMSVLKERNNLRILEESESFFISWGGSNLARAQIALADFASRFAEDEDYLVWISGRDFPLKPIGEFADYLNSNRDVEHIGFFLINEKTAHFSKFITRRYYYDRIGKVSEAFNFPRILTRAANRVFNGKLSKPRSSQKLTQQIEIACGYPRFALRNSTYLELKESLNQDYWKYFDKSHAPDDMLIHTLFCNSDIRSTGRPGLVHLDLEEPIRSVRTTISDIWCKEYHLEVIDDSAIEHLKNCGAFFARKFDYNLSQNVLESL